MNSSIIQKCDVSVEAIPSQIAAIRKHDDLKTVHISNIKRGITAEIIRSYLKSCGAIASVEMLLHKNGQPKCEAFVEFIFAKSTINALKMTGTLLEGKRIKIQRKGMCDCEGEHVSGNRVWKNSFELEFGVKRLNEKWFVPKYI